MYVCLGGVVDWLIVCLFACWELKNEVSTIITGFVYLLLVDDSSSLLFTAGRYMLNTNSTKQTDNC